jgi:hypothetical protein
LIVKLQRYFLATVALTLLFALAVGLTQAQQPAAEGKDSGGPLSAEAAVTTAFTYQGVLKENGAPVTGSRNMVFELHNNNTCAGTPLITLTKNGVAVVDGFFSVSLDFGQGTFDGQALWLQAVVTGTDIGCQELTTVPYALSLRPGATIRDANTSYTLRVYNDDTGDAIRAYSESTAYNFAAVYAINLAPTGEGSAIFGSSIAGSGVYAKGSSADIAALRAENENGPVAHMTADDGSYGARMENTGSGDGLRSYSSTSAGTAWAAVYAYNTGSGSGVWADSSTGYAGYFAGDIYVDGNCVGCLLVYTGLNSGDRPLAVGDLVAVNGVESPLAGTTSPVLRLTAADATNGNALLGVVQSAVVQGLAQVNVSGPLSAGERVAFNNGVAGRATAEDPNALLIGRAVETSPNGGLVWVMLDIR